MPQLLAVLLPLWLSGCATPSAQFLDGGVGSTSTASSGGTTTGAGTSSGGTTSGGTTTGGTTSGGTTSGGTTSGGTTTTGSGGTTSGGSTGTGSGSSGSGGSGNGSSGGSGGSGSGGTTGSGGSGSGSTGSGGSGGSGSGGGSGSSGSGGGSGSGGSGGSGSGGSGSGGSGSGGSGSGGSGSGGSGSGGSGSGGSGPGGSGGGSLPAIAALASDSFVDAIGINTHLTYTNTAYASEWPKVLGALKTLGVRHIRDGYYNWAAGNAMYTKHQQLAAAGIGTNFVVAIGSSASPAEAKTFAKLAGDVESFEGPNECDAEGGRNCGGAKWLQNLQTFLPTVTNAGKAAGVPVYGPSFVRASSYPAIGNIARQMTMNNLHIYFGGRNPESGGWGSMDAEGHYYGSFAWWLDNAKIDGPGLKSVATESGYIANATVTPYTLPQNIEAMYVPRTLLMAYKSGLQRTYLYELLDEVSSPGYGLMDGEMKPKAAYTALANLISLTSDPGAAFTPGQLEYQIDGGDSNLQQVLLQKRDGSFLLILWVGSSGYDPATNTAMQVKAESVTLNVAGIEYLQTSYQLAGTGKLSKKQLGQGQSAVLSVSDEVSVIEISGETSSPQGTADLVP